MKLGVAFISDRGDRYLPKCVASLHKQMPNGFWVEHVVDDSAHQFGMAGAVRQAWDWALDQRVDFLLHVEEDFLFTEPIALDAMRTILRQTPRLAQVVLKRQPWSPEEVQAGGIIEMAPDIYEQQSAGDGLDFVEHRRVFSLNPCLVPRIVLELGWPDGNEAEFTTRCLAAGYSFAFYGRIEDPPRVQHVGAVRGSGWRL